MRCIFMLVLLFLADVTVTAGPLRRQRQNRLVSVPSSPSIARAHHELLDLDEERPATTTREVEDALAEVNAVRAQRGLRPFLPDPLLQQAAYACARIRATNRIESHLRSDFAYLPAGASAAAAGCGALEPSWGWGTCCTYDDYTYAGASWVMGTDGKRYMHLFVR